MMSEGATALMYACQQGSEKECLEILKRKPDAVRDRDRTQKTALHYCAENIHTACAEAVLRVAPDIINVRDEDGYSSLHLAVIAGNKPFIQLLISRGADINAVDNEKHSVVHWATGDGLFLGYGRSRESVTIAVDLASYQIVHIISALNYPRQPFVGSITYIDLNDFLVCGELEALDLVLRTGASISCPDIHGGFPLHYAAQMCGPGADIHGDPKTGLSVLRTLLSYGANVDATDKDGRQPILWAASADRVCGYEEKLLLQADGLSRDPRARFRSSGSADAILTLVKAGANVESADKDGLTALHCAASRGHTDCLETLVALCGANVDTIDMNGCTALFYATTLGHADSTQLLLNLGAEPNRQDRKGRTPAHCGAAKGQLETLRILLSGGANLWLRNVKGDLPLHEAVASGRRELVMWLLNQRAESVNVANNDGKCPIHVAAINNNVEMIKILLDSGSLVNPVMRSNKGELVTPLDAALLRGHRSTAKFLQLHGGVPKNKLNSAFSSLRGTLPSRDSTSYLLTSGKVGIDHLPLRKTSEIREEDIAIQHIERINVSASAPLKNNNDYDGEIRTKKKTHRRKSERRKRSDKSCSSSETDENSSSSRPQRKSGRRKRSKSDLRKSRDRDSKKSEESLESASDNGADENNDAPKSLSKTDSVQKVKEEVEEGVKTAEVPSKHSSVKLTGQELPTDLTKPLVCPQEVSNVIPQDSEVNPGEDLNNSADTHPSEDNPTHDPDSSFEENNAPLVSLEVEADVHQPASSSDTTGELVVESSPNVASKISDDVSPVADQKEVTLPSHTVPGEDAPESMENSSPTESPRTTMPTRRNSIVNMERDFSTDLLTTTKDVAFYTLPDEITSERRSADGSECHDGDGSSPMPPSLLSLSLPEHSRRSRRKSEGAITQAAQSHRRRSLFTPLGDDETTNIFLQERDVDTVIKNVLMDSQPRPLSLGEESVILTHHDNSSAIADSGIEPSPGHDRFTGSPFSTRKRIPRFCNRGHLEKPTSAVSVTRAVQSTIRKYHLERKIFYQLLELKRMQIRAGRANEQVLVKRLVDDYQIAGKSAGLSLYDGHYSFRQFERFLYDQLHKLQAGRHLHVGRVNPADEMDVVSTLLKKSRAQLTEEASLCTQTTHRCSHAAHAYTGIPCAAYITKLNHHTMPKGNRNGFLPTIDSAAAKGKKTDGKFDERPITLEVIHGDNKQMIKLPTESLDRSKRYFVTFSIKSETATPPKSKSPARAIHHHAKTV